MSEAAPPVPGRARWLGFAALAAGLAMIVLDGTVVSIAMPAMIDDLGFGLADAQLVNSIYPVAFAALLLTFGRLGDRHGRRLVFLIGVVVFAVASLTAAGATDVSELIASRSLQGVGGAMILPATLSTVNATFRGRDRSLAFGLWGAIMAAAAAIGPLLAGWLTTSFSWQWVFLINVPLGLVVLGLGLGFVPETVGERTRGFDGLGLVTSAVGLGLLVFGLVEGPDLGWIASKTDFFIGDVTWPEGAPASPALVALVAGTVLTGAFLVLQQRRAAAGRAVTLDLGLFAFPVFAWGNLTAAMVAVGEFALLFVLPLYLVYALQLSILQAGWVLAAMAGGAFVAGARARSLAARLGPARVVSVGLAMELVATAAAAVVVPAGLGIWPIVALLAVYGLGLGLASAQLTSTVLRDVPVDRSGVASATQSTVRQLGSALGAAVAGTVLASSFAVTVPARLALVKGVSADDGQTMIDYMTGTAGAVIAWIREKGNDGHFGKLGPRVAHQLSIAFAESIGTVLWVAAAFMALGLIGALQVERASRTVSAGEPVRTPVA
jgi:EmrB/QacA subfamily drug resistance transporter